MAKNWIEKNLEDVDCVLTWSSDKSILNYNGRHIIFHTVDKIILQLEDALLKKGGKIVLLYPVSDTEVLIPMVVEGLYSLINKPQKNKVILISDQIAVREHFSHMKANYMKLNDVFPFGIVKIDGSVKAKLKTTDTKLVDTNSKFLHSSNIKVLPGDTTAAQIGMMIVDTRPLGKEDILYCIEWCDNNKIPALVFLETNPYSDNNKLFEKHKIPIWGWDSKSLYRDFKDDLKALEENPKEYNNPFSLSVYQIKNWLSGINRSFLEVETPDICNLLNEALNTYFDLIKMSKQSKSASLRQATYIFVSCKYAFERMLAPLQETETECKISFLAKTFENRITELKRLGDALEKENTTYGSFWGKTHSIATELYNRFMEKNPKYDLLLEQIKKKNKDKKYLIFNYSEPFSRALIISLCRDLKISNLEEQGIFVTSIKSPPTKLEYDKCIVFGQVPFNANWLIRTALAKELLFLVYPSEKALLKHQFSREESNFVDNFSTASRVNFMKYITGKEELTFMPEIIKDVPGNSFDLTLNQLEMEHEKEINNLFEDIEIDDDLISDYEEFMEEETEDNEIIESMIVQEAIRIDFEFGGHMYVRPSRKIPVLKKGSKIDYLNATNIKEGNSIVLINNGIRSSLADEIIKKADKHPKMQKLKFMVNLWSIALNKGLVKHNDTVKQFLVKLQKEQEIEGIRKVTNWLTIYLWKKGYVIGPQNSKNIMLIGKIYGEPYLVSHYQEIGTAISRIRGIHQKLLRRFNIMAVKAGLRSEDRFSNELIDAEFDLHLEDFVGIISIKNVKKIIIEKDIESSLLDKIQGGTK